MTKNKNQYDYISGSNIAENLEKSQINKFHTKGGTGFAAEEANALNEKLTGHKVEQVGKSNELNGADRILDGCPIQTKYYDSAKNTVGNAFDTNGTYRYKGQLLEVPSDQYDESLSLMRKKIKEGKVPGVTDPADAESIIKKGSVSYNQARNIAKAGTIDGLVFDIKNQCVTSSYAFAISFTINFAKLKWDGVSTKDALNESVNMALLSGATSFITGVATAQVLRSRTAAIGVVVIRNGVKAVSQTQLGKAITEKVALASLGKAVYGAAATNHVAKLLRTNVVTSVITTAVITAPDFYRAAFSGSISWAQFTKNLAINGSGVAGGTIGWMAGAAQGAAIGSTFPGVGTAAGAVVGGVLGALAAGTTATVASKFILDGLIEDDAKEMIRLLPEHLQPLASDYLLSESEVKIFSEKLKEKVNPTFLRDMYKKSNKARFVYLTFEPLCEEITKNRPIITPPNEQDVNSVLEEIEKTITDNI